nr:bacillithiol biosynthesis cysteine-adding enzyme BshC [Bacilli bacterium]
MNVWQEQKSTGNPLTDAYLRGDSHVADLYDYPAHEIEALRSRVLDLDRHYEDQRRAQVVAAIREYMKRIVPDSQPVADLLDKLSRRDTLVVVTGQQAGLFTGPLYTLYKAMSTIVIAKEYEETLNRPVVPVFWIASEDHDFDEVASAYYVRDDGLLTRAHLHDRPPLRTPVGHHDISKNDFLRLMNELAVTLPDGVYKHELLHDIDNAFVEAPKMDDFFAKMLVKWLHDLPILLVNPMCREFREPVRDAFRIVIEDPDRFRDAAQFGARKVVGKGFTPQVDIAPAHSLLYFIEDKKRCALDVSAQDKQFLLRDAKISYSKEQLLAYLEERPEDFSAGVLYRPVVQDFLLPVITYVGGAAEIAYHGMMREIFHAAGRKMPPLRLRQRIVLVPRRVSRALLHYDVALEDALSRDVLDEVIMREFTPSIDDVIVTMQTEIQKVIHSRKEYFTTIDEDLLQAVMRTEQALHQDLARLQGRAHRTLRRNRSELVTALTMVNAWLRPQATEQERVLSPLSVIAKYGVNWLAELAQRPSPSWDEITYYRW